MEIKKEELKVSIRYFYAMKGAILELRQKDYHSRKAKSYFSLPVYLPEKFWQFLQENGTAGKFITALLEKAYRENLYAKNNIEISHPLLQGEKKKHTCKILIQTYLKVREIQKKNFSINETILKSFQCLINRDFSTINNFIFYRRLYYV